MCEQRWCKLLCATDGCPNEVDREYFPLLICEEAVYREQECRAWNVQSVEERAARTTVRGRICEATACKREQWYRDYGVYPVRCTQDHWPVDVDNYDECWPWRVWWGGVVPVHPPERR